MTLPADAAVLTRAQQAIDQAVTFLRSVTWSDTTSEYTASDIAEVLESLDFRDLVACLTSLLEQHGRMVIERDKIQDREAVAYDNAIARAKQAEARLAARDTALWALEPYIKQLRVDASGEAGRMSSDAMYALADKLHALRAAAEPPLSR